MIIYLRKFYLFRKEFSFVVNFVKLNKSEIQHDIHKIYSHVIETSSSKLETHHEMHKRKHVLKNTNANLQK